MKNPRPWKSTAKSRKASKQLEKKSPILTKAALAQARAQMEATVRKLNG